MLFEWHFFNVSKKFKVQRSLNIVCIVCKMLAMFQQEHISIPCFKYVRGDHATHDTCPVSSWIYGHAMPHLVPFKIHNFLKKLSWKRCTYFINYYIEYIWPLTCNCLSFVTCQPFFCVWTFKKMRKIQLKREYSIVDGPFFVGKKLPNFEKKTRKKLRPISPLPLWLWLQVAIAHLNILI